MFPSKRSDLFVTAGAELTAQSYCQLAIAVCVKLSLVLVGLTGCASAPVQGQAPRSPTPASVNGIVQVQTIAKGLEHPWSLAILPDKRMLVTERRGRLRLVGADGRVSEPLAGVPQVYASGQGGLLDVVAESGIRKGPARLSLFCRSRRWRRRHRGRPRAARRARARKHPGDLASAA